MYDFRPGSVKRVKNKSLQNATSKLTLIYIYIYI